MKQEYTLLDSGDGQKWERFGEYTLLRPCSQALWKPALKIEPDATFDRDQRWVFHRKIPKKWNVYHEGILFELSLTEFGHLGIFPEHTFLWKKILPSLKKGSRILNLFAYSGGATLALAKAGAEVCHLDASKGMVDWARNNAKTNHLEKAPIRWIVDDAEKFLKREEKRGSFYDGIFLDPPTFGRGSKGEVFKIERDILPLLELCKNVLSKQPLFVVFSCHTPGMTPLALHHLLKGVFAKGNIEKGEMVLESEGALSIPSGSFAIWTP